MTPAARRVLFLPGASGDGRFWHPVSTGLPVDHDAVFLDWPGLGHVPRHSGVRGLQDCVDLVVRRLDEAPGSLVAQSMGGVVAVLAALARPARVERLVLTATSGGIDTAPFHPEDWRPDYQREYPEAASWVCEVRLDLSAELPGLRVPTLLVWSDTDPISPIGVGRRLQALLPRAELVVIPGVDHMFARDHPALVVPHIARHLAS